MRLGSGAVRALADHPLSVLSPEDLGADRKARLPVIGEAGILDPFRLFSARFFSAVVLQNHQIRIGKDREQLILHQGIKHPALVKQLKPGTVKIPCVDIKLSLSGQIRIGPDRKRQFVIRVRIIKAGVRKRSFLKQLFQPGTFERPHACLLIIVFQSLKELTGMILPGSRPVF